MLHRVQCPSDFLKGIEVVSEEVPHLSSGTPWLSSKMWDGASPKTINGLSKIRLAVFNVTPLGGSQFLSTLMGAPLKLINPFEDFTVARGVGFVSLAATSSSGRNAAHLGPAQT